MKTYEIGQRVTVQVEGCNAATIRLAGYKPGRRFSAVVKALRGEKVVVETSCGFRFQVSPRYVEAPNEGLQPQAACG